MVINKRVPPDTATATLFAPGTIVRLKVARPLQTVYNKISGTLRDQTFSDVLSKFKHTTYDSAK
jgi:hypothetical protein